MPVALGLVAFAFRPNLAALLLVDLVAVNCPLGSASNQSRPGQILPEPRAATESFPASVRWE